MNINETSVTDRNNLVLFAASFLAMPSQKSSRFQKKNDAIAAHNTQASRRITFMNPRFVRGEISMHFGSALVDRLMSRNQH
ncbi:hypothetical protein [Paraburkholderia sp. BL6669N2]|uniref:hypothetical protein n=1 Tax=Paraburkholderia sp. BL6669N2 TaxID=1938807 RepID=UPI0011C0463E|nr:hypothetical protein [Paraburkholderia sp. BL6669N2]